MTHYFFVGWRGRGHWDIDTSTERLFCIRGVPGAYYIRDERAGSANPDRTQFPTVDSAMAWICATLMSEHIEESPK